MLVDRGGILCPDYQEVEVPLIRLGFDYGGVRVRAADPLDRIFLSGASERSHVDRNHGAESRARYLLESFGVVELGCLESFAALADCDADYVVDVDGDIHALCSFGAYAVPQLRSFGWRVEIDPGYQCQVIDAGAPWYADLAHEAEGSDWFSLELGVEVDGRRLNLLPALLDLIDASPRLAGLDAQVRSSRRFLALPVGDSRYLPVPAERLRMVARVLVDLYEGHRDPHRGALRLSEAQGVALAQLDLAFADADEPLRWHGASEARLRGLSLAAGPDAAAPPPAGLQAELRPYQLDGLRWLQHLRANDAGGVLADDMGLGKTLQTIAHLLAEKEAGRLRAPVLVVAPTSLVGNWRRELRRFAPQLHVVTWHGARRHERWPEVERADVVITTYALVSRDQDRFAEQAFYYLILDEAQTIKNPGSQAHRAVKALDAEHHLCLTGTPIENNLEELWALFDLLAPGLLGSAAQFRTRFRTPIERDGKARPLEALRQRVAPFILRRMKDTVAGELPPKTEIYRPVELSGAQRDLYESIRVAAHARVRQAISRKGVAASTVTILDALMKLRQVCCDPKLVSVPAARAVTDSAKLALLDELLTKQLSAGRRVLVFSQFTSMLALIAERLRARGIDHAVLTGATDNRQRPIDAFQQGEVDVFLISLKAGGTGLNLVGADTVVHYDPWWNPAAQAQATDRAYRIGQTRPVFVYNLIVAGSVEERMVRLQRRKRQLADGVLGAAGEERLGLSPSDVDDLFAPLAT